MRKKKKQSRAVLNTALSYSIAFMLSYLLPVVISIRTLSNLKSGFGLSIAVRILFPLQGFFNFCVYLYPHITSAKRKHKSIGWFSAFLKALMSRGPKRKVSRSLRSGGRKRTALLTYVSDITSKILSRMKSSRPTTSKSRKDSKHILPSSGNQLPVSSYHTSTNIITAVPNNPTPTSAVSRGLSYNCLLNIESNSASMTVSNVESVNRGSEFHPFVRKSTGEKIVEIVEACAQQEISAGDGIAERVLDEEVVEDEKP